MSDRTTCGSMSPRSLSPEIPQPKKPSKPNTNPNSTSSPEISPKTEFPRAPPPSNTAPRRSPRQRPLRPTPPHITIDSLSKRQFITTSAALTSYTASTTHTNPGYSYTYINALVQTYGFPEDSAEQQELEEEMVTEAKARAQKAVDDYEKTRTSPRL